MTALPEQVNTVMNRLESFGFEVYVVGGAVRDALIGGKEIDDWDLATNAKPRDVIKIFDNYKIIDKGVKHGTVTVIIENLPIEITTYRRDGKYSDGRHPTSVSFLQSLKEDLVRRDFTMNALAYSPKQGIIDYFGGTGDICRGEIRCVGNPTVRFTEDALRIIRALRFASVLQMRIENETAWAIHLNYSLLLQVAPERLQPELTKTLCGIGASDVIGEYPEVFTAIIPEIAENFKHGSDSSQSGKQIRKQTLEVLRFTPQSPVLRWAVLLRDARTTNDCKLNYKSFGNRGDCEVQLHILNRLKFDKDNRKKIFSIIRNYHVPVKNDERDIKKTLSEIGPEVLREILILRKAEIYANPDVDESAAIECDKESAIIEQILTNGECFSLSQLAIDGDDVVKAGYKGREVGRMLRKCLASVIEGETENDYEALVKFVREEI